jgi:hypothetical protein
MDPGVSYINIPSRTSVYKLNNVMQSRDGIFKLVRNPRIDSKESILAAYLAWRAGTITLFLLGS